MVKTADPTSLVGQVHISALFFTSIKFGTLIDITNTRLLPGGSTLVVPPLWGRGYFYVWLNGNYIYSTKIVISRLLMSTFSICLLLQTLEIILQIFFNDNEMICIQIIEKINNKKKKHSHVGYKKISLGSFLFYFTLINITSCI